MAEFFGRRSQFPLYFWCITAASRYSSLRLRSCPYLSYCFCESPIFYPSRFTFSSSVRWAATRDISGKRMLRILCWQLKITLVISSPEKMCMSRSLWRSPDLRRLLTCRFHYFGICRRGYCPLTCDGLKCWCRRSWHRSCLCMEEFSKHGNTCLSWLW